MCTPSSRSTPAGAGRRTRTCCLAETSTLKSNQTTNERQSTPHTSGDALGEQNSRGLWLRHWAVQHLLMLANTLYKKQDYNTATYHSSKHCVQLDHVLMSRALYRHCRDAEATGRIDMNSDHKAVRARIEVPTNHRTRHILRPAKKPAKQRSRGGGQRSQLGGPHGTHLPSTPGTKPSTRPTPTR